MPDADYSNFKCEGCGSRVLSMRIINTTNGSLRLCTTCLDDVNRKNPDLIAANAQIADLSRQLATVLATERQNLAAVRAETFEQCVEAIRTAEVPRVYAHPWTAKPIRDVLIAAIRALAAKETAT